jgi:hypothetical protein
MDTYKSIISGMPTHNPPHKLLDTILQRVNELERRRARRQLAVGVASIASSFVGMWYGTIHAIAELQSSSFSQYMTVFFSDIDVIGSFWKESLFAVTESFPAISVLILLSMIFIFLNSLRSAMRGIHRETVFTH